MGDEPGHSEVVDALAEVAQVEPEARERWIRDRYPGGSSLLDELLSLVPFLPRRAAAPDVTPTVVPDSEHDPMVDVDVGDCVIRELIGRGGMGDVYAADQLGTGRRVAVKILPSRMADPRVEYALAAEGAILARLNHPYIARVFQAGLCGRVEGGRVVRTPFIVMELLQESQPIDAWAAGVTPSQVIEAVTGIADALAHAHDRGVIHGDIKPGNILIDAACVPHLIDFGTAAAGVRAVTPSFSAPECLEFEGSVPTVRSDLYSLGLVLQRSLKLAAGASAGRLQGRHRRDAAAIVRKAIAPDPSARFDSAARMAADLRALRQDRPVSARRQRPHEAAARVIRQHPARALGVAALLLVIGAAGQLLIRSEQRARHAAGVSSLAQAALATHRGETTEALARLREAEALGVGSAPLPGYLSRRLDASLPLADPARGDHLLNLAPLLDGHRWLHGGEIGVQVLDARTGSSTVISERGFVDAVVADPATDGFWVGYTSGELVRHDAEGLEVGQPIRPVGDDGISSLATLPDGQLVIGTVQGRAVLCDRDATPQRELLGAASRQYGGGTIVVPWGADQIVAATEDGDVWRIPVGGAEGEAIWVEPDSRFIAMASHHASGRIALGLSRGAVVLDVSQTGGHATGLDVETIHSVWSVQFVDQGRTLALGDRGGRLHLCDPATGQVRSLRRLGDTDPVWQVLELDPQATGGPSASGEGHWLAVAIGRHLVATPLGLAFPESFHLCGELRYLPRGERERVVALRMIGNDTARLLLSSGSVLGVDLRQGTARRLLDGPPAAASAISSDGRWHAALRGAHVTITDLDTLHSRSFAVDADPVGTSVLGISRADAEPKGRIVRPRVLLVTGTRILEYASDGTLSAEVTHHSRIGAATLAELEDGDFLALCLDHSWLFPETQASAPRSAPWTGYQCLGVGDGLAVASPRGWLQWWPGTETREGERTFSGHTDMVTCADLSPARELLASGGRDRRVRIWDWDTGEQLMMLEGHTAKVAGVGWSDDGRVLASVDTEGHVQVWSDRAIEAVANAARGSNDDR